MRDQADTVAVERAPGGARARGRRRPQRGFTLIEVLIGVLVLSVGLLGLAALQTTGLRAGHGANLRTQATLLVNDMAERMRANRSGREAGHYDDPAPVAKAACAGASGTCSPQDMASHDRKEWDDSIARALPQGAGVVCLDDSPDDGEGIANDGCGNNSAGNLSLYAVKVWWADGFAEDGAPVVRRLSTGLLP